MTVLRLSNGDILAPMRVTAPGMIGDATVRYRVGSLPWKQWDRYLRLRGR